MKVSQWITNVTLKGLITLAYFNPPTIYIAETFHLNDSIPNALEKQNENEAIKAPSL